MKPRLFNASSVGRRISSQPEYFFSSIALLIGGLIAIGTKENKNKEFFVTLDKLKEEIWNSLGLIKVFTKQQGKAPEKKPVALKRGNKIRDLAKHIHKDFLKKFDFARIWGKSAKHPAQRVGMGHMLEDNDIVEIHLK